MTGTSPPVEVFYSYAHEDEALRTELEKHLSLLRRQGVIRGWHDRHITSGTDWAHAIDEHLERAAVILLLVSADAPGLGLLLRHRDATRAPAPPGQRGSRHPHLAARRRLARRSLRAPAGPAD